MKYKIIKMNDVWYTGICTDNKGNILKNSAGYIGVTYHTIPALSIPPLTSVYCNFDLHIDDLKFSNKEPYCPKHHIYAPEGTLRLIKAELLADLQIGI